MVFDMTMDEQLADFQSEVSIPCLVTTQAPLATAKEIGELEVGPCEQPRLDLGSFTKQDPPRGFSVQIIPAVGALETIVAQVITLSSATCYKPILYVANFGNQIVRARVWQL